MQPHAETMPNPWDFFLSSPAVVDGTVFFGSGDGYVYALEAASGRVRWRFKTGSVVHSSPAVASGIVYVGNWDSFLYALDAGTGRELWRFKTRTDEKDFNQVGIQSSPTVVDGTVYFGCRDSTLYAVDARSGQKKWAFSTQNSWVITTPVVVNGTVVFGTSDTAQLTVVDQRTGAFVSAFDARWPIFSSPAVSGAIAYFGTLQGRLVALDLRTHNEVFSFQTDASKARRGDVRERQAPPRPGGPQRRLGFLRRRGRGRHEALCPRRDRFLAGDRREWHLFRRR